MNLKLTMALALLFMGLASITFLDLFSWQEKKEKAKQLGESVAALEENHSVEWFAVTIKGVRYRFDCVKKEPCKFDNQGDWQITEPQKEKADDASVGALLSALKNLQFVEKLDFPQGFRAEEFGFDKPSTSLEYKLKDKNEISFLRFGRAAAVGSNTYASKDGNNKVLYIVADYFPQMLLKDPYHWRNKRLFIGWEPYEVQTLAWSKYSFVKNEAALWQMQSPLKVPASQTMIEGLVATLLYTQAKAISTERPGKELLRVEVLAKDKKAGLKVFAKPNAKKEENILLAQVEGSSLLYEVEKIPFDRFEKSIREYREGVLLRSEDKNLVSEFEMIFPKEKKSLRFKLEGEWKAVGGDLPKEPLSQKRIQDFLDALSLEEALLFAKGKNTGTADLQLQLFVAGQTQPKKLEFFVAPRSQALANGDLPGEYRLMAESFAKHLPVRYADLYESNNKKVVVEKDGPAKHEHQHGPSGGDHGHSH